MRNKIIVWILFLFIGGTSCSQSVKTQGGAVVIISSNMGDIKIKLYDETPFHRDNFLKLVREGYYDDLLFHRVIHQFMIQGGDPESKNAAPGTRLGNGGPGYTVPAEFVPGLFHKKGALAAARTGDQMNPQKASSGSQFYIVQGKVWRSGELDSLEISMNGSVQQNVMRSVFTPVQEELNKYRQENNQEAFNRRVAQLQATADSLFQLAPKVSLSEAQRQAYTTLGGTPHLDGGYTVFGEIIEGLEVLDKIAAVKTDQANRPLENIKFSIKVIE